MVFAEQPDQRCVITIVAYDYFSEFAMICGLLSAFGLNIEEGDIYTFSEKLLPYPLGQVGASMDRGFVPRPPQA